MTRQRRRGFSLIELLVVIFILAVGLTSISALFVSGIISSRKAERTSTAVNTARKEMERLRSGGFASCVVNDLIFNSTKGYTILVQNADGTGQVGFPVSELYGAQGTIDISYYDSGSGVYPNLKDITVTVTWPGGAHTGGTVALRTLIANHP